VRDGSCVANEVRRRHSLQRLFSTFPRGLPGLGLLLLRVALGTVLIAPSATVLVYANDSTFENPIVSLLEAGSGVLLLFGFLTPVGSVLATLVSTGIALSWIPQDVLNVIQPKPAAALVAVMAAALALLGPGTFSIDCRLYGRREIVIPRFPRHPEP
jgi:uncharacterized membrane protein YphA (DoxX/SURF4 family)